MKKGKFGEYGGQYVNEILMPILIELEAAFEKHYPTARISRETQRITDRIMLEDQPRSIMRRTLANLSDAKFTSKEKT